MRHRLCASCVADGSLSNSLCNKKARINYSPSDAALAAERYHVDLIRRVAGVGRLCLCDSVCFVYTYNMPLSGIFFRYYLPHPRTRD